MKFLVFLAIILVALQSFTLASEGKKDYKFSLIGDWGTIEANLEKATLGENARDTFKRMAKFHAKDKVDGIISVGDAIYLDMAYAPGGSLFKKATIDSNRKNLPNQVKGAMDDLENQFPDSMFTDPSDKLFWNVIGNHDCSVDYREAFNAWKPQHPEFKYEVSEGVLTKTLNLGKGKTAVFQFFNFCKISLLQSGWNEFKDDKGNSHKIADIYTESNWTNAYWSKPTSLVEYINLTGKTQIPEANEYLAEIKAALKKANEAKPTWHIVVMHNPYLSEGGEHGDSRQVKTFLHPLFAKYNIHLVLNGHEHISQFSTIPRDKVLHREDMLKPRSPKHIFFPFKNEVEKLQDAEAMQKWQEMEIERSLYGKFGEVDIDECRGLYQIKDTDTVTIDVSKNIANALVGNTDGRGIAFIGRAKGKKGCNGTKILPNNGQLSQGDVHYVNSKYFGWADMTITADVITINYHHAELNHIASQTFTAILTKGTRRRKNKKFLKKKK